MLHGLWFTSKPHAACLAVHVAYRDDLRVAAPRSYIVWCRRRDLAILICAAVAAVVLGIEMVAWLVNA